MIETGHRNGLGFPSGILRALSNTQIPCADKSDSTMSSNQGGHSAGVTERDRHQLGSLQGAHRRLRDRCSCTSYWHPWPNVDTIAPKRCSTKVLPPFPQTIKRPAMPAFQFSTALLPSLAVAGTPSSNQQHQQAPGHQTWTLFEADQPSSSSSCRREPQARSCKQSSWSVFTLGRS